MRVYKLLGIIAFILFVLTVALLVSSHQVAADDCTWIADTAKNASDATAWQNGSAPVNGSVVYTTNAHTGAMTWNLAITTGKFSMGSGGPSVTLSVSFGVTNFYQKGGNLVMTGGYIITNSGDYIFTGGSPVNLGWNMTGTNKVYKPQATVNSYNLIITGSISITSDGTRPETNKLQINPGGIANIATGQTLRVRMWSGATYGFVNSGAINGPGILEFTCYNAHVSLTLGSCNAPVAFRADSGETGNYIFTLPVDTTFGSTINIVSDHASRTATLNCNGKTIRTTGITVGLRGILNGTASLIYDTGPWDSSAGTWNYGTSTLYFSDSNSTLKVASGQAFNKLEIVASGLTPKWIINNAGTQTIFWNVTGLNASRNYNYYVAYVRNSTVSSSGTGTLAQSWSSWTTKQFELRLIPLISGSPVTSINEFATYNVTFTADQNVTWTLTTNASWLTWSGTALVGTPSYLFGAYPVSLHAHNTNGDDYKNFTLTVNKVNLTVTGSPPSIVDELQTFSVTYSTTQNATWNYSSDAPWLHWSLTSKTIYGIPGKYDGGKSYEVHLSASNINGIVYLNFTVNVKDTVTSVTEVRDIINDMAPLMLLVMYTLVIAMTVMILIDRLPRKR